MTRLFAMMLAVAFVAVLSTSARADEGQISQAQLAELGLGGMEMVSDEQGEQIRGKFVFSPAAIIQLQTATFNALAGPLGPTAAGLFAQGQTLNLLGVNSVLATKFPPPAGLAGYGTVGTPGNPFNFPYIINTIPGL